MKPTCNRTAWPAEPAIKRVQRCLSFLRVADLITEAEQVTIMKRVSVWKADHAMGKAANRRPVAPEKTEQ